MYFQWRGFANHQEKMRSKDVEARKPWGTRSRKTANYGISDNRVSGDADFSSVVGKWSVFTTLIRWSQVRFLNGRPNRRGRLSIHAPKEQIASRRIMSRAVELPIFSQYSHPKMPLSGIVLLGREECEEQERMEMHS